MQQVHGMGGVVWFSQIFFGCVLCVALPVFVTLHCFLFLVTFAYSGMT
jgi:hypothetical protein